MKTQKDNLISFHYDDIFEVLDIYNNNKSEIPDCNRQLFKNFSESLYCEGSKWFGDCAKNFKQCLENALYGNTELYNFHILPMIGKINTKFNVCDNTNIVPVIKRRKAQKGFGDELDIHKINQGKLDVAWRTTERIEFDQEHHLITLLIDIAHNANIDARDSYWLAASVLKITESLERAGKQVQIIVGGIVLDADNKRNNLTASFTVKKYNQHLNVERLAPMCCLGFFRTACFLAYATNENKCKSSLGHASTFKTCLPIDLQSEVDSGKTKVVLVERALSLNEAIRSIQQAQKDLINNSGK